MSDDLDAKRTVIRRLFVAQLGLLGAGVGLTIILSIVTRETGTLIFAFILGGLGGSVSLFRRLPLTGESEMQSLSRDWISTLVPVLYGGLMALVTYLLFMSGILTGDGGKGLFTSNLFPNFTTPTVPPGGTLTVPFILQIRPASIMDVGKLLVWSFLAGYSERFVTSVLGALEQRGAGGKS